MTSFDQSVLDPRLAAAADPSTPAAVLTALAALEDVYVRVRVARNPSAPAETLSLLAGASEEAVRRRVARNPSAPAAALTVLAGDSDEYVRRLVAANPSSTPNAVLTAQLTGMPGIDSATIDAAIDAIHAPAV